MSMQSSRSDLLRRAEELLRANKIGDAIEAHRDLLDSFPDLPDSWYNLGYLQQRMRQYSEALASYQQALNRGIRGAEEVRLNRAYLLAECFMQIEMAELELLQALVDRPDYIPARLNLGNLFEQQGRRQDALEEYQKILIQDPTHALALARLAGVVEFRGSEDPLLDRLRRELQRPKRPLQDIADIGFSLGRALDSMALYDEAFATYTAANSANARAFGRRQPKYDPAAHERYVDRLIDAFPVPSDSRGSAAPRERPPVFICGMFRSGSSLVENLLAGHPEITAGGEMDIIPIAGSRLLPLNCEFAPLDEYTLGELARTYLAGIADKFDRAGLVTDKRPDNFLYMGLIKSMFPNAKFVHTTRNPLDNCLAIFFAHLGPNMAYGHNLADIAHWFGQYRRLMAHWRTLYADDIIDVNYDELVLSPRQIVMDILRFVGLSWDDGCMLSHKSNRLVKTPSAWQVRRPIYASSSGRWRHYERHVGELRTSLAAAGISTSESV